jgi:uncharacterized protein
MPVMEDSPRSATIQFPAAADAQGVRPLLTGRLRVPARPIGAAVLCHPHPAFGGTMDVWLLPRIGERLAADGWAVLRFDVRGVGASQPGPGAWDGATEHLDLAGAVARVREEIDAAAPVALVGWSFGALLGLLHGPTDPSVAAWVGVAPPTRPLDGVPMVEPDPASIAAWEARRDVIVGAHDQHFPPDTCEVLHPHAVHVVPDADHFFFDRDAEVADLVATCLRPLVEAA